MHTSPTLMSTRTSSQDLLHTGASLGSTARSADHSTPEAAPTTHQIKSKLASMRREYFLSKSSGNLTTLHVPDGNGGNDRASYREAAVATDRGTKSATLNRDTIFSVNNTHPRSPPIGFHSQTWLSNNEEQTRTYNLNTTNNTLKDYLSVLQMSSLVDLGRTERYGGTAPSTGPQAASTAAHGEALVWRRQRMST